METARKFTVHLEGLDALDLSAAVLRDLCDLLVEGSQRAARLVIEGRSQARGGLPGWVSAAGDLRVTRYAPGSLDLGVSAPELSTVAPEFFAQQTLFPGGIEPDATALDLFLDAAQDAFAEDRESERLDAGMLEVLARAGTLFARGGTRMSVAREGREGVIFDPERLATVRVLAETTPPPRVVRVAGMLDTLTASTKAVVLKLTEGGEIRGFAGAVPIDELREYLGTDVVMEGPTTYRPSGDPLRIEIDYLAPATPRDRIFGRAPRVEKTLARPRVDEGVGGLGAVFGAWPGDETDEEIERLLSESA